MRRHELTDEQYLLLEPYLPKPGPAGGHPWAEHRRILNGLFWKLHIGAQWCDIPERYGPWKTIHNRYRRWCQEGQFAAILAALRDTLGAQGLIDWEQWWIDSTNIRASRAAAGARKKRGAKNEPVDHALGRSQGGFGTKVHLLCDGSGVPLTVMLLAGQAHESTQFEALASSAQIRR